MMSMNLFEIIKTVCDNIKATFPETPIHIMQLPQGFKRPAFSVKMIGFADQDLCKNGLRRKLSLDIVCFSPQDAKGSINAVQQLIDFQKLLEIFQRQSLKVNDRYLKITNVDGGPRDAEIYLTVRFEYTFSPSDEIEYEIMQQLFMDYQ